MINSSIFNYRVVAIIRDNNGRILLQKSPNDYWFLPGGRCDTDTFSREAVISALKEKTGADIETIRPAFLVENIFNFQEARVHEVGIYYLSKFTDHSLNEKDEIKGIESGKEISLKWFAPDEIDGLDLRPAVIKQKLKNIPEHMEIIETRQ
jgi:8-oxo-dGTP pyrophosphatase MutT (NUDIX family)